MKNARNYKNQNKEGALLGLLKSVPETKYSDKTVCLNRKSGEIKI